MQIQDLLSILLNLTPVKILSRTYFNDSNRRIHKDCILVKTFDKIDATAAEKSYTGRPATTLTELYRRK